MPSRNEEAQMRAKAQADANANANADANAYANAEGQEYAPTSHRRALSLRGRAWVAIAWAAVACIIVLILVAIAPAVVPVLRGVPEGPGGWSGGAEGEVGGEPGNGPAELVGPGGGGAGCGASGPSSGQPADAGQPVVVASFSTALEEGELTRNNNIRLAAEAIDGTRLAPGAVFSFNAIVGPRIREKGYQEAKVIVEGAAAPGIGGGICQVSTTLYNVALLAGMEILERHHHSRPVGYVPLGRDATVAEGSLDLKFRNPTRDTIILRAGVDGNRLLIEALAERPLGRKVEILTSIEEVVEPRVLDNPPVCGGARDAGTAFPSAIASGREGYKVLTWRVTHYLDEDGGGDQGQGGPKPATETRELISEDYYRPVDVPYIVHGANRYH